jgi:hypothetical protein
MDQEPDSSTDKHPQERAYQWRTGQMVREKPPLSQYPLAFAASAVLLGILLTCLLGQVALQHSIIKLPCFGRYFGDPFTQPSSYVKLGFPRERQFYDVEFGRSLPVVTGVEDTNILLLRFPIDFPHPCFL